MKDKIRKHIIFWSILVLLVLGAYWALILYDPRHMIQGRTTFLFGLTWIWNGIALLCHVNPLFAQEWERKHQIINAVNVACMGAAWVLLSFLGFADEILPITIVSLPFLVIEYVISRREKKKSSG